MKNMRREVKKHKQVSYSTFPEILIHWNHWEDHKHYGIDIVTGFRAITF